MIELTLLDYIKSLNLVGTNVFMEVPEDKPEEYIIIQRTGGTVTDVLLKSTVAIQCYSKKSKYRACVMSNALCSALIRMQESGVSGCVLNSTYEYPSTNTKEYRYQSVFEITHYRNV